ncbi:hypothetical protein CHS0354_036065 [Potamilus streckersoni]|uniref:DRBM domain-containing protein n=1 Tax=Potamilus streckersoni TaxID=2493646 RepID=A0AAE0WA71_9BIVA|nr:hypothetical protein CHS0354_036065 [Potamilus streckersoni]
MMIRGGAVRGGGWGGNMVAQKRPFSGENIMQGSYPKKPATNTVYVGMESSVTQSDMYGTGVSQYTSYGGDVQMADYGTSGGYSSMSASNYGDKSVGYGNTGTGNIGNSMGDTGGYGNDMGDVGFVGGYGNGSYSNVNYKSFDMQQEASPDFTDDNIIYEQAYIQNNRGRGGRGGHGGNRGRGNRGRGATWGQGISATSGQEQIQGQGQWTPRGRGNFVSRGGGRGGGRGDDFQKRGGKRGRGGFGVDDNAGFVAGGVLGSSDYAGASSRGGKVPPVHTLSKIRDVDLSQMSVAEKIRRFCLFLQNDTKKVNAIQTIENGLTGSKLGLKTEYHVQELIRLNGKPMYTGDLKLSSVFLVRSVGANKKEVKHEVYQKALDILTAKSVAEIFNLKDPGIEAIRLELQNSMDQKKTVPSGSDKLAQEALSTVTAKMTNNLRTGLEKLILHIQSAKNLPENVISLVEQAITASHCNLKHKYEVDETRMPSGRFFFRGALKFEDVVIARGKGFKKKETKTDTYSQGMEALKTKSLDELMEGVKQEIEPEMQGMEGKGSGQLGNKDKPQDVKFEELIKQISAMPFRENNINIIDQTAMHLGLTPTCIYKKLDRTSLTCELYLDNILIATGEGEKRKESQIEAYNKAWEVLTTSDAKTIITEHKKLSPEDSSNTDANICDVMVKGAGRHGESNIAGLRRYRFDPNDVSKTVKLLVIMEHPDWAFDRKRHAFCILQYSSTLNGMLLQWRIEGNAQNFRCIIHLQGQYIGESFGMSKSAARNLAAADALFKLYETQDVILITKLDDSKHWIPWSTIEAEAESLQKSSGEVKQEPEMDLDGKPKANKWILKAVEKRLEEFSKKYVLEELIFGPGMQIAESKEIRNMAKEKNLRYDNRQHQGQMYMVIYTRMSPPEMAACLKSCSGKSGKYSLTPRDELPKHSDVVEYLKTATSSVMIANKTKEAEIDFKQDVDFSF